MPVIPTGVESWYRGAEMILTRAPVARVVFGYRAAPCPLYGSDEKVGPVHIHHQRGNEAISRARDRAHEGACHGVEHQDSIATSHEEVLAVNRQGVRVVDAPAEDVDARQCLRPAHAADGPDTLSNQGKDAAIRAVALKAGTHGPRRLRFVFDMLMTLLGDLKFGA